MPTVRPCPCRRLGVLACLLTSVLVHIFVLTATASESASGYRPRPISYVVSGGQTLVVYYGPTQDCQIAADPATVSLYRNVSKTVSASRMSRLIERCQEVHARLYARNPAAYYVPEERQDRLEAATSAASAVSSAAAGSKSNSLWSLNVFNRILIFPGTKWCGQGAVAEHIFDIGFHSEADRCCR